MNGLQAKGDEMDTQNDGNALKNSREGRENAKKSVKNIDRRK